MLAFSVRSGTCGATQIWGERIICRVVGIISWLWERRVSEVLGWNITVRDRREMVCFINCLCIRPLSGYFIVLQVSVWQLWSDGRHQLSVLVWSAKGVGFGWRVCIRGKGVHWMHYWTPTIWKLVSKQLDTTGRIPAAPETSWQKRRTPSMSKWNKHESQTMYSLYMCPLAWQKFIPW